MIAAAMAFAMGPSESQGFDLWDTRTTVFTGIVTCGLFLALMTAANSLGLRWGIRLMPSVKGYFSGLQLPF